MSPNRLMRVSSLVAYGFFACAGWAWGHYQNVPILVSHIETQGRDTHVEVSNLGWPSARNLEIKLVLDKPVRIPRKFIQHYFETPNAPSDFSRITENGNGVQFLYEDNKETSDFARFEGMKMVVPTIGEEQNKLMNAEVRAQPSSEAIVFPLSMKPEKLQKNVVVFAIAFVAAVGWSLYIIKHLNARRSTAND